MAKSNRDVLVQNLLIKCDFSVMINRILHSCSCIIIEFIKHVGENR